MEEQESVLGGVPTIDGFADLHLLGHGGFASVYEATDVVLHRKVALKVIKSGAIDDRRFHRECRILASLSGVEGIVSVFQAATALDGRPVIVMRMYRGGTLADRIGRYGPLDAAEGIKLGAVLAAALGVAHRAQIFHRDIKPSNVLFDDAGAPAVSDFGIAISSGAGMSSETLGSLSPPHAPPERFGEDVHTNPVAGDVYSLGSTLYFGLAGRCPFGTAADEGGLAALMERVTTLELPPIERKDMGADLNAVLAKAMAKDPWDRFDSMEGFLAALRSCHPTALASWTAPPSQVIHAGSVPVAPRVGTAGPENVKEAASVSDPTADADSSAGGPTVVTDPRKKRGDRSGAGSADGSADPRRLGERVSVVGISLNRTILLLVVLVAALVAFALGAWLV